MNAARSDAPLRLALDIDDALLADRLTQVLAKVEEVELVSLEESPEAVVRLPAATTAHPNGEFALTSRELEVLTLLAEGASNKSIASRLGISVHTAKFHVRSLLDKFDAVGRTDAVAHAARRGMIHL